jgi:hypothetical protein
MCTDTALEIIGDGNNLTRKIVQISNVIRLIISTMTFMATYLLLPRRTSYWIAFTTTGTASGKRKGSKSPRRASSAIARQPPCQAPSPSLSENSSKTAATTSSPRSFGRRLVIRPIPLAADQRTIVSRSRRPTYNCSTISSSCSGISMSSMSSMSSF